MDEGLKTKIRNSFWKGALRVNSLDPHSGEVLKLPIKDVMRHDVGSKKILKIKLSNQAYVVCTEDHSLIGKRGSSYTSLESGTLSTGDTVTYFDGSKVEDVLIEEVFEQPFEKYMYDLCVPGTENFVLSNGIVAHNSYSIGGVSLDLDKASKYESAKSNAQEQFDKQLEKAKLTVKITKGLQQPKYGTGIRSSFGPFSGRGVLSPRKFMGI